jgi:hypothetical protein
MAVTIDSTEIELGEETFNRIVDFVGPYIDKKIQANIRILVQKQGEIRHHKTTARDILRELLRDNEIWYRKFGYDFNFDVGKYCWDGKRIYLTSGEILFLYRCLMLNQFDHNQRYFIYNIRKRYGKEFLQEAIHV